MKKRIGVLALQGSVIEHLNILSKIDNVEPQIVKTQKELMEVEGLIIPGGESTTMGLLLNNFNLMQPLKECIKNGLPVWGTCAGMILLAKEIEKQPDKYLEAIDIRVKRNAYGSQLHSFTTTQYIDILGKEIELVFIRAPYVVSTSESVDILSTVDDKIVAVKQGHVLATSFHPELTNSPDFHNYFVNEMVR